MTAAAAVTVVVCAAGWGGGVGVQGAWEGSLARYEPDGTFVERTPTVLFIYTDSKDDAARVAAGGVPYRLDLKLRYGAAVVGAVVATRAVTSRGGGASGGGGSGAPWLPLFLVGLVGGGGGGGCVSGACARTWGPALASPSQLWAMRRQPWCRV